MVCPTKPLTSRAISDTTGEGQRGAFAASAFSEGRRTMSQDGVSRRHFFFGSLLAGAVPLAGYGSVPSLRALGYKPFYDKLNVAAIGCGGQGLSLIHISEPTRLG